MASFLNRGSLTLGAATVANFGSVLVGLWAISRYAEGDDQVALLNLWAAWGIALGLLGQVGLISGVLDRQAWVSRRNLLWAGFAALITIAGLLPVRGQLFAQKESWVLFAGVMTGALYLLGRQRAALSLRQRGVSAVVVTAAENVLRAALLAGVLAVDRPALGAIAIAAPLALSLVAFASLAKGEVEAADSAMSESRSVAVSLLAGVPAVLAYAVVPLLTLFGSVDELDQVAFAATLLRGPLIVAAFLAPWFLDRVSELTDAWRHRLLIAAASSVVAQILFAIAASGDGVIPLIVSAVITALAAVAAYLLVVLSPARITTKTAAIAAMTALAASTGTIFFFRSQPTYLSFLGVGIASLLIVLIVNVSKGQLNPNATTNAGTASVSDLSNISAPGSVLGKDAA